MYNGALLGAVAVVSGFGARGGIEIVPNMPMLHLALAGAAAEAWCKPKGTDFNTMDLMTAAAAGVGGGMAVAYVLA